MEVLGLSPRRLGAALLVFGATGIALAAIGALVLLAAVLSTASLNDRLEGSRVDLVAALEQAQLSIGHAADTTDHVGSTLGSTRTLLDDSSRTLTTLGDASDGLAASLQAVSVLGAQPFSGAATQFRSLAGQVRQFAGHATQLSSDLAQHTTDSRTVGTDLRDLQARLGAIATKLDGLEVGALVTTLLLGLLFLLALTVWLAVGAIACAWAGYRIRLRAMAPVVVAAPEIIVPGDVRTAGSSEDHLPPR